MYLQGFSERKVLKTFNITKDLLHNILNERNIPIRKGYYNGWFFCSHCGRHVLRCLAGKVGEKYYCPFCGKRLRTKPRRNGGVS
jgi:predicted RNA-binding Zn-ribbon protein involved in translation (DUF1610 family)